MADDPSQWEAITDEEGSVYYYNRVTGESAWEAPPGWAPPPQPEGPARPRPVRVSQESVEPKEGPNPGATPVAQAMMSPVKNAHL